MNFNICQTPKNFKFSKKKRIRNKQIKKYTKTIYKGCIIIGIDYGYQKDFAVANEYVIRDDKMILLNMRRY